MLPEKLSTDESLEPESLPIIKDTNKGKREGLIVVFLMAAGVGIVVSASILLLLLPSLNPLVDSVFSSKSTITDSASATLQASDTLAPSFKAIDGGGNEIGISNGVARSEQISISGYSDVGYSTELECWIDTLPVYCDGSPIIVAGLPDGVHEVRIVEPGSDGTKVSVFDWTTTSR